MVCLAGVFAVYAMVMTFTAAGLPPLGFQMIFWMADSLSLSMMCVYLCVMVRAVCPRSSFVMVMEIPDHSQRLENVWRQQ